MTEAQLRKIWEKTKGRCHFCGDRKKFGKPGQRTWEVDHVVQRGKGGKDSPDNYLAACVRCNRLRWHRTGKDMQRLLHLGVIALQEMDRWSSAGEVLRRLERKRYAQNRRRRTKAK